LAATGQDHAAHLWDVEAGRELDQPSGHTFPVKHLTFLAADALVTASFDGTVRRWDTTTGRQTDRLLGSPNGVASLATSGQATLVARHGGLIEVVQPGQGLQERHIQTAPFSPNAR